MSKPETITEKHDRLQQALIPVRDRFQRRCGADLAEFRASGGLAAAMRSPEFHIIVHRIAGMAGTFGLTHLGCAARAVDDRLTSGELPEPRELAALEAAMAEAARLNEPGCAV